MIIQWHCRGCNAQGDQKLDIMEIYKNKKKKEETIIDIAMRMIQHDCPDKNIGIRTT